MSALSKFKPYIYKADHKYYGEKTIFVHFM